MAEFFHKATGGPGRGIWPTKVARPCVNRSGTAYEKGDLVMFDLAASVAELTTSATASYQPGDDSVFDTITDCTTASASEGGIFGVVTEDGGIANDAVGEVLVFGLVEEAFVIDTRSGTVIIPGSTLVCGAEDGHTQDLDNFDTGGEVILGRYLDASGTASTHRLARVLFNGFAFNTTVNSIV